MSSSDRRITVGGGCFWCTEAVFEQLKGVKKVISGYSGGTVPGSPTYREVSSGLTGHAEVIQATYDANMISYKTLLEVFMTSHDPTTLNRQGADVGTQYRSVIFYETEEERQAAVEVIAEMQAYFEDPIVTQVEALQEFYPAEEYHQNYYKNNPGQGYCQIVISPKISKLRVNHQELLKSNTE